jgi:hypothetical protein
MVLQKYSDLRILEEEAGAVEYLSAEVTTSTNKEFKYLRFIDTPGLVDGHLKVFDWKWVTLSGSI